jgi:hypothetical protein
MKPFTILFVTLFAFLMGLAYLSTRPSRDSIDDSRLNTRISYERIYCSPHAIGEDYWWDARKWLLKNAPESLSCAFLGGAKL